MNFKSLTSLYTFINNQMLIVFYLSYFFSIFSRTSRNKSMIVILLVHNNK